MDLKAEIHKQLTKSEDFTFITYVAFNNILLGEFMLPDWDMFRSHHVAA
jgi:hypothetical protein